jgi:hypothetical protein
MKTEPKHADENETERRHLPIVCAKLRTKMSFGSFAPGGPPDWREGTSSTAVYWCLKTMETWGTDDDFAHPQKCRAGRACFVSPAIA